jgi:uncharacterized protein (DUF58 family)
MDEDWKKYFDPLVLERLRGMSLRSRHSATGAMAGMHRSTRSGQAIEFSEHRQYTPGEDLRQLDWKVLGRTDKYYLRQREDETTMRCHLLVDRSGSMAFRGDSSSTTKLQFALQIAASLAFVASENRDSTSLTCLGETVSPIVDAGSGSEHLMALAMAMGRIECQADAAIANQIQATMRSLPSGGLVILISDVFEDVEELLKSFRAVRTTGRSMIVVQVIDPMEFDFPFGDTVEYIGLEGEPAFTVDASGIGAAYREEVSKHQRSLEAGCRSAGIPFWILPTNVPLHTKLPEFVNSLGR